MSKELGILQTAATPSAGGLEAAPPEAAPPTVVKPAGAPFPSAAPPGVTSVDPDGHAPPDAPPARRRRPGSAARLASIHAVILALVLGISVVALVRNFQLATRQLASRELVAELQTFRNAAVQQGGEKDLPSFAATYLRTHALAANETVVIQIAGVGTVGSAGAANPQLTEAVERILAQPVVTSRSGTTKVNGHDTEFLAAALTGSGRQIGVFVGTADLSSFDSIQSRIVGVSAAEGALALAVGVVTAFLLLRRLLRTVGRITTTADRIGKRRLHDRLGDQGTDDEVGQLARSFDTMLDRLEGAVGAQQQLLSDLSHQLRTPLTVARGHLEVLTLTDLGDAVATGETVQVVVDELDHMRNLIDRLSLLGQAMEPDSLTLEDTDLRELLGDVFHAAAVLASREWILGQVDDVVIRVDEPKLRGALLNLVDNAVKATAAGDRIEISGRVGPGGEVRLGVADSGPGIAESERAAVLGRFRGAGSRRGGGTGLGLAIVKALAEAHGGNVEIATSAMGGAAVTMVIPR